jgi:hypothetical protein
MESGDHAGAQERTDALSDQLISGRRGMERNPIEARPRLENSSQPAAE